MRFLPILLTIFCVVGAKGQHVETDSLRSVLASTKDETERIYILESLSYAYLSTSPDTALYYAAVAMELAEKSKNIKAQAICSIALGNVYFTVGDYSKALEMFFKSIRLKDSLKGQTYAVVYFNIANIYTEQQDYRNALVYVFKAKQEDEKAESSEGVLFDLYSLSAIYLRMNLTDSAHYYSDKAYALGKSLNDQNLMGAILNNTGEIYMVEKNIPLALKNYKQSIPFAAAINDYEVLSSDYLGVAKTFNETHQPDSAVYYAKKALTIAQRVPFLKQVYDNTDFLTEVYRDLGKFDSAFKYVELKTAARDSLFNVENIRKIQNLKLQEQQRQQTMEAAALQAENKVRFYSVFFVSLVFLAIAILLWRNNRERRKAYSQLEVQKIKTEEAYHDLKSAQAQLIHSEKMASLGELTAGIAHEIQNPLNFVKNFSEVNSELIDEFKEEFKKGNAEHLLHIINSIHDNEQKIIHHGRRADSIVKGMLQHSRINSGKREPTDINALADEYVRLAYHGLKAKDKSFNAKFTTDFDPGIGKIDVVPQEIGRVILNLVNNAFYAVSEKRKLNLPAYEPLITIQTKKLTNKIRITLTDNGVGIPKEIVSKIFNPFFTTKPTGQGTGLGLSLSYDIIKAHKGEIQVNTSQGEGAEFVITLSI